MKTIKFRAFYRGKMYNNVIVKPDGVVEIIRREGNVHTDQEKSHLMQFTGLHDKNGKEIYEGDILKSSYTEFGHEVVFDKGHFSIKHNDKCCPPYRTSLIETRDWQEIIGNIYLLQ